MSSQVIDMVGRRFGNLVVIESAGIGVRGTAMWRCQCDCGKQTTTRGTYLRIGHTSSCGCGKRGKNRTHGLSETVEYKIWEGMHQRCGNPNNAAFAEYGGRGIKVCDRWRSFTSFLADMGERPTSGHSIDRYPNNDGDYEPGNCRWATRVEQANNRRPRRVRNINISQEAS